MRIAVRPLTNWLWSLEWQRLKTFQQLTELMKLTKDGPLPKKERPRQFDEWSSSMLLSQWVQRLTAQGDTGNRRIPSQALVWHFVCTKTGSFAQNSISSSLELRAHASIFLALRSVWLRPDPLIERRYWGDTQFYWFHCFQSKLSTITVHRTSSIERICLLLKLAWNSKLIWHVRRAHSEAFHGRLSLGACQVGRMTSKRLWTSIERIVVAWKGNFKRPLAHSVVLRIWVKFCDGTSITSIRLACWLNYFIDLLCRVYRPIL